MSAATPTAKSLLIIGAGPGIARAVSSLLATKGYTTIILLARRASQLATERQTLLSLHPTLNLQVHTIPVDITDPPALALALAAADEAAGGPPSLVFFNAARVIPSTLFEHPVEEIEYDFKVTVSALYAVAGRYLPEMAERGGEKPGFIVTSSALPAEPVPELFALSLTKAAQKNLVRSLWLVYGKVVHVGVVNVAGAVDGEGRSPAVVAGRTWEWFEGKRGAFEVVVE
ncbi:hypothetical protein QBC39DRAFT_329015 [Podospora conica]|nr:hypothetical protein QBC39DRAFT_329015 [Schizothecium conicum]